MPSHKGWLLNQEIRERVSCLRIGRGGGVRNGPLKFTGEGSGLSRSRTTATLCFVGSETRLPRLLPLIRLLLQIFTKKNAAVAVPCMMSSHREHILI